MRKLSLVVLMVSAVGGGFVGCGGTSPRRLTGAGGAGGNDGGIAGTGSAGSAAGTGGAAGDTGTAGGTAGAGGATGGAGGATGGAGGAAGDDGGAGGMAGGAAGGTAGAAGATPPVLSYCEMHPEKVHALPYTIAQDFKVVHVLSNNNSAGYWKVLGTPDCSDNPTYPPFPSVSTDGGVDGSGDAADEAAPEAGVDGGAPDGAADVADETLTLQLDDPDASDGGVADAAADAPVDAPADVPASDGSSPDGGTDGTTDVAVNDGGADAGPPLPACYEFSYDPDGCVGTCWAGVVFEVSDVQGPSPDTKGVCIQTGAMNVEFWARASKNNARVKFGSIGEGPNTTEFYLNITTTWTRYTTAIPASLQTTYNTTAGDMQGVWNAFSVVVEQPDHAGGTYIEIKDIHWIATQ